MVAIRIISALMLVVMVVYTNIVVLQHGINFIPEYVGNIATMNWAGQFQMDFTGYLVLSAMWVGWRHRFSGAGIALAVGALTGGMLFFSTYLLVVSIREKGDVAALLLGRRSA